MSRAKVKKWGNSLAVRIPKAYATDLAIEEGSAIDLSIENGVLRVAPRSEAADLRSLLEAVTDDNLHEAVETGPAIGREVW